MRGLAVRIARIALPVVAVVLPGPLIASEPEGEAPAEAPAIVSPSRDAEIARARAMLSDLLVSDRIARIDFRAETRKQGMARVHAAVDAILEESPPKAEDVPGYAEHAAQVIEALSDHPRRGLAATFGEDARTIVIRSPEDARTLGVVVSTALSILGKEYGADQRSYSVPATRLFRSVILDLDEGPLLDQYRDGIRRIADAPPERRSP